MAKALKDGKNDMAEKSSTPTELPLQVLQKINSTVICKKVIMRK